MLAGDLPPLSNLRVLDLSRLLPGGYATQMLTDLGADVLKIEEPGVGDYARTMPPLVNGVGTAFFALNRGKRSAAINLKHPAGRDALLRLAEQADVLIESFRPGVLARLGLGHETLHQANPRLTICAITAYGQKGPYRHRAGHDLNYIGYAGLLSHFMSPGQPPTMPGTQLADIAGGALMAVIGILAALVGRQATGKGRIIDVAMLDGTIALMPLLSSSILAGDREPLPGEALLAGALPGYNIYATADGRYLTVAALEPKFWEELCQRLDRPDLVPHQFPQSVDERNGTILELARIFGAGTLEEWMEKLADADVCVGPVSTFEEALANPQLEARGITAGRMDGTGEALRIAPVISGVLFTAERSVPALGQHTADALAAAGFTPEEIAGLVRAGAVAAP
ncbi:MAG: CaiB/BaiF CoA transferase family protein [Ktedonobacterales bacterium]